MTALEGEDVRATERRSTRVGYRYRQRIAPVLPGRQPGPDDFTDVRLEDLSTSGCGFWLERRPEFEQLLVELGRPPQLLRLAAKIVWVKEVSVGDGTMFRVGCQFTGRYG